MFDREIHPAALSSLSIAQTDQRETNVSTTFTFHSAPTHKPCDTHPPDGARRRTLPAPRHNRTDLSSCIPPIRTACSSHRPSLTMHNTIFRSHAASDPPDTREAPKETISVISKQNMRWMHTPCAKASQGIRRQDTR